jgi:uncharacterized RDD family membrane protein YckC
VRVPGLTRAGSIVGTPAYLAPEQAAGGPVDHRADMYALGASLFEALTGAPPFDAPTPTAIVERQRTEVARSPRALVADLHPSLEGLVLRLLHRDPAGRFATYDELRGAIARARMPAMVKAPPVPRLVAFAIDYAIFAAFGFLVFVVILRLGLGFRVRPVAWALAVLAASLIEWRLGGVSIGKRLMQMRTSDRYGLPPGFASLLARTALKTLGPVGMWLEIAFLPTFVAPPVAVVTILLWLASFVPALGQSRLALHDRLTRTRVIFAEAPPHRPDRGA